MKFSPIVPIIYTTELHETINFYTNTLGFTCNEINEEWGWASLQKGECEIMVTKPNEHIPFEKPQFTGSFYIKTEKVDELWEHLKDTAKICYELETFDWGMREFAIYDNNGYMIQFGEELDNYELENEIIYLKCLTLLRGRFR
ncbi:VOC family protein [Flavobacterium sp. 3HN19-14]|uniref:VOC family protein n=1 Tax=Flavobacterium sp. 3HN19-14 TaxID=3448133 RepID=UPI003EDFECB8